MVTSSTRRAVTICLLAALAFCTGWFMRGRLAIHDEALRDRLDLLVNASSRASADRLVLVMIEKERTQELQLFLVKRLAEDLTLARKHLTEMPGSTSSVLRRFSWSAGVFPNLVNEFKRSAEYLARHGGYPEAVRDAEWLAEQLKGLEGS